MLKFVREGNCVQLNVVRVMIAVSFIGVN